MCQKIHAHPADWSKAPYGYTLGDSTRFAPVGAPKETAYATTSTDPRAAAAALLVPGTTCHGFAVERCETVPELDSDAYVLRHTTSGARLLHLACNDENKAFAIGFKTPPADSTGVFHILEHSVLCGSAKFPVKEPFVDLIKSSMQTFLNAMTYPDKTIYPVATTNEQDLYNLMDVYLDAVFNPAIYTKPTIFEQEAGTTSWTCRRALAATAAPPACARARCAITAWCSTR